jgi:ribulose-phosphate 3-epimerase
MPRHALPALQAGKNRPETRISPSILSADFARLADETKRMEELGAQWHHIDVMVGAWKGSWSL